MKSNYKILTPIVVFLFLFISAVSISFAQSTREATFGGRNETTKNYRLTATRDTNGAYITVSPANVGWYPAYQVFSTSNTTNSLSAVDSGRRLIDISTYGSRFVLPKPVPGLEIEVCSGAENTVTLDTQSIADTIIYTISGTALNAGDSIVSSGNAGDCVRVTAGDAADTWYITGMGQFQWTDNGSN